MTNELDSNADPFKKQLQIDEICDRFEIDWQRGDVPALDQWVSNCNSVLRDDLVASLLAIDQDYRNKAGKPWSEADYLSRYPDLHDASRFRAND
jgi:hypothetical protein